MEAHRVKTKRVFHSHKQIVDYWINYEKANKTIPPWGFFDWNEPACMACGIWSESWDEPKTYGTKWFKSKLEKCHVIPLFMGGPDTTENIVLMCGRCHYSQPDNPDPLVTYKYMQDRKAWMVWTA